jgi:hypothetical protein
MCGEGKADPSCRMRLSRRGVVYQVTILRTIQRLSLGRWSGKPLSDRPHSDRSPRRIGQGHGQTGLVGAEIGELLEMLFLGSRNGDLIHGILNSPQQGGDTIGITQNLRDILSVHLQLGLDDIV